MSDEERKDAVFECGICGDAFPPEVMTCYALEPDALPAYTELCPLCLDEVILS